MSWEKQADGKEKPPAGATAEGGTIPASFEQAITEANELSKRLNYLLKIIQDGGPTFENSHG